MTSPTFPRWQDFLRDRRLHEFLWYCVPGVCVALLVRTLLTAGLPYGQYHFDTPDFLQTPYDLFHAHRLTLHNKKTFLTPFLYTLPLLFRLPALIVIPLGQHLLGTLLVLMIGALARLWFTLWRWWIVPLMVLTALQPSMLWFEHTLLAESHYVFCVVWAVLAGTIFARYPGRSSFAFFLVALFFTAGSRPEGRLFLAFGALLILFVYAYNWRVHLAQFAIFAVFCVATLFATRTHQGGILLYSSLLHLAPDESRVAPGIMDCLRPLREQLRTSRSQRIDNDVVRTEKRLSDLILNCYSPTHPEVGLQGAVTHKASRLNNLCLKLAIEAARQHPFRLPGIVVNRFRSRLVEDSGGELSAHDLHERQFRALDRGSKQFSELAVGLTGVALNSDEDITRFIDAHYDAKRVEWYDHLEKGWLSTVNQFRLPDSTYSAEYRLPGLPWLYVLAVLGAMATLFLPGSARAVQWSFLPVLVGVWFTVTLTGALVPRYRFVLEPFWLLYFFAFTDAVARLVAIVRKPTPSPNP